MNETTKKSTNHENKNFKIENCDIDKYYTHTRLEFPVFFVVTVKKSERDLNEFSFRPPSLYNRYTFFVKSQHS